MPIYEYRCNSCEKTFEYMQRMTEDPKKTCEACGQDALERLISATSFTLKGSGWYKDLYSSAKPAPSSGDGDKSAGKSDEGASSKKDSGKESAPKKSAESSSTKSSKKGSE